MVQHNSLSEKGQERISAVFSTLQIGQLLRKAGISKSFGLSSLAIFRLIFTLVFEGVTGFVFSTAIAASLCLAKMWSIGF